MSDIEFKEKVDEMFKEYPIRIKLHYMPNQYWITDDKSIGFDSKYFWLVDNKIRKYNITIYRSSHFQSIEEFYDEIIIFKELILLKYL